MYMLRAGENFHANRSRSTRVMRSMISKISPRHLILIKFHDLSSTRQNFTRKCSHLHNTALCGSIQEYYLGPGLSAFEIEHQTQTRHRREIIYLRAMISQRGASNLENNSWQILKTFYFISDSQTAFVFRIIFQFYNCYFKSHIIFRFKLSYNKKRYLKYCEAKMR